MNIYILMKINRKSWYFAIFAFILGCMVTVNLVPFERTCKLNNEDVGFNIMNDSKFKDTDLVILIISAPNNADRRYTVRNTWLVLSVPEGFKFIHYFVIGTLGLTESELEDIYIEQSQYSDMLLLPMYDSYGNLSEKVAKSFYYLSENSNYGVGFKYVLKCDDDSFVYLHKLSEAISKLESLYLDLDIKNLYEESEINTSPYMRFNLQVNVKNISAKNLSVYWGYFNGNAKIKSKGKWKEVDWIACDRYTPYALGGGYIVSKSLVHYVAKNIDSLRYFHSEDVSVGFWLAPVNNILRIHDIRFDTEWTTRGCQNIHFVTHNIIDQEMDKMYTNIDNKGKACMKETLKRHSYMYNWNAPASQCCAKVEG